MCVDLEQRVERELAEQRALKQCVVTARVWRHGVAPSGKRATRSGWRRLVLGAASCGPIWRGGRKWYDGELDGYDATWVDEFGHSTPHHITYDDDDDEYIHLGAARWTFLVSAEVPGVGEMPAIEDQDASSSNKRRSGRRKTEVFRDMLEHDFRIEPQAKRAARSGKAYADQSVEWRRNAKQVFREAKEAVKSEATTGDLLKELQAYREAFAKLEQVLK